MKTVIVVTSSNKYYSLLEGFEHFVNKYWKDCEFEIHYCLEDSLAIDIKKGELHFNPETSSWSQRLIRCLKLIETDNVILMCEDYFIFNKVNQDQINNMIKIFSEFSFDLLSWYPNENLGVKNKNLITTEKFKINQLLRSFKYKYHIVAHGIYKKDSLLEILRPTENIWEFENFGSFRANLFQSLKIGKYISSANPLEYHSPGILIKGKLTEKAKIELYKNNYKLIWNDMSYSYKRTFTQKFLYRINYWIKNIKNLV